MAKLSIIVPIYNVEEYLSRCLDSILAQTYEDFEAILVDDGSPDRCGEIIDAYSRKDKRIITIHQENRGVSAARNAGLKLATGDYIGFVDPDDWISTNMYDLLIHQLEKNNADIVCCGWIDVTNSGEDFHAPTKVVKCEKRNKFIEHIFDMPRTIVGSTCICNKMFKRKKIIECFDEQLPVYEDTKYLLQYCLHIDCAVTIPDCTYYYYHRGNSLSHESKVKNSRFLKERQLFIDICRDVSRTCKNKAEAGYIDACYYYLAIIKRNGETERYLALEKQLMEYLKKKRFEIIFNPEIKLKAKVLYLPRMLQSFLYWKI